MNNLLHLSDIVISDISSIILEAALIKKNTIQLILESYPGTFPNIDLKDKTIDTFGEYSNVNKSFDEIIGRLKNINPTLFNYPRTAKYISGKFDSTLDWDGEE